VKKAIKMRDKLKKFEFEDLKKRGVCFLVKKN